MRYSPDSRSIVIFAHNSALTGFCPRRCAVRFAVPLTKVARVETELLGGHGPDDRVTRSTLGEYVGLVCSKKMVTDVFEQMSQIQKGLLEVVPAAFMVSAQPIAPACSQLHT